MLIDPINPVNRGQSRVVQAVGDRPTDSVSLQTGSSDVNVGEQNAQDARLSGQADHPVFRTPETAHTPTTIASPRRIDPPQTGAATGGAASRVKATKKYDDARDPPIDRVLRRLGIPADDKTSWSACCPAHGDVQFNLAITATGTGTALLHCYAGCKEDQVTEALGLTMADLFAPPGQTYAGAFRMLAGDAHATPPVGAEVGPDRREAARHLRDAGYSLCRPDPATKRVLIPGWSTRSAEPDEYRPNDPIGILGGPLSAPAGYALVIVDIDCLTVLSAADVILPATGMVEGRPGKPRSHRYYLVPVATIPPDEVSTARDGAAAAIAHGGHAGPRIRHFRGVDLIGTGGMVVCPPSLHPSGERREWDGGRPGTPAVVDYAVLRAAVDRLVAAAGPLVVDPALLARARAYLATVEPAVSGQGGHATLYRAACRVAWGWDLPREVAIALLVDEYSPRCLPPWTRAEVAHKVDDALVATDHHCPRGYLREDPAYATRVPSVMLDADEHRVTDEVMAALAKDDGLYVRGGEIVRVAIDEDRTPVIVRVSAADLRRRITQVAFLKRHVPGKNGEPGSHGGAHPPEWLTPQCLDHPDKSAFRPLSGISTVPVLRPNGSIHDVPGYDAETRTIYLTGDVQFPSLPEKITQADAADAAATLLGVVSDFPFASDAGGTVWVSLILSVMGRHLIDGPVPGHLGTSTARGSGKTLMIDTAGLIVLGRPVPVQQYSHDGAEMRKLITAIVSAGKSMVHFDNLQSGEPFGNPALDSALTCSIWEDRLLGGNTIVTLPIRTVWCATGNNVPTKADTGRRFIFAALAPTTSNPEDRSDFRHPDLLRHVAEHRGEYVVAALTMLAGYLRAGRPEMNLPAAGSFSAWTSIVRQAITWAGLADPWITNHDAREDDGEAGELASLIEAWSELDPEGRGLTVAEAKKATCVAARPKMAELLATLGLKDFDAKAVGLALRKHKGRITAGGRRIVGRSGGGGVIRWRVDVTPTIPTRDEAESDGPGGDDGDGGSVPSP